MNNLLDIIVVMAVSFGVFFFVAGTLGLLRFPDSLTRLHAVTKADNLGLGLVVFGLMLRADSLIAAMKLASVWLLLLLTSATLGQLIAAKMRSDDSEGRKGDS